MDIRAKKNKQEQAVAPGQKEARKTPADLARENSEDAFTSMPIGPIREAGLRKKAKRAVVHRKIGILAAILAVVFVFSMLVSSTYMKIYSPLVLVDVVKMAFRLFIDWVSGSPDQLNTLEVMAICPEYYEVTSRIGIAYQAVLCGGILALAGSLYQMVFRNPIAAPTMLGVSNGINVGILILVLQFTYQAPYMFGFKYAYCYLGAVIVLAIVLLVAWIASGRRGINITQLLLVGSLLSQILGTVIMFVQDMFMTDELWTVYQEVNEALHVNSEWYVYVVLTISFLVAVVPVFLMRYSINAVNYADDEARLAGIDATKLKVICLVFSTIMVIVAQVHNGQISMISLVIPFVARALFGTEFRGQMWGDLLIGALLLLICRDISTLIPFAGSNIPIGTVVSFIVMPVYMFILAKKQRGWE